MENLGRINLLVGTNNCGKTSILEAIDILADYPDVVGLGGLSLMRGAHAQPVNGQGSGAEAIAMRHLFFGHPAQAGAEFVISSQHGEELQQVQVQMALRPPAGLETQPTLKVPERLWLVMNKTGAAQPVVSAAPLTPQAEWLASNFAERYQQLNGSFYVPHIQIQGDSRATIVQRLSEVALNPEEQLVLQILRILSPDLEGITVVNRAPTVFDLPGSSHGVYVKLRGQRERVPIGTLGAGVWRLLGLALALVKARGRVLLVDEIETGLHYTAQVDMWKMVKQAAEELDVQVFATTHSRDCIDALAAIARPDVTTGSEVTIQRIEGERAISYSEREIVLAAERGIEVR